ncbi:MAG TPA: pyrimidine reductase family protein [Streptosporangiaceae bacterium]|nr:pyrimidine reductase family protein [Streptosporangiaceae bacterium]
MRQLCPPGGPPDLAALYGYPTGLNRAWVRANMIESIDGAAAVDGRSGGLSGPADREVFGLLRALADVILVGAGTARAEKYRPARIRPQWAGLRAGRPAAPPIAVLSGRLDLDLDGPLLTAAAPGARTIVITSAAAPADRRAAAAAHAEVILAGDRQVDVAAAVGALAHRGQHRILAEGGPHLLGQLARTGLLDELCVTVSPVLAGGPAGRIIQGPDGGAAPARAELAHVLADRSYLFCRYLISAGPGSRPD